MTWPDWTGEVAVIVASGPSAADVSLGVAKGRARFLAVKDGWRLCPWADALYACDHHWWEAHRGVLEFHGRRMAYDRRTVEKWRGCGFLKVEIDRHIQGIRFEEVGRVGWGGNSGFHAVNLAAQFGARALILVGFDMRVDRGRHFFGEHPYSKSPSEGNVLRWAKHLDKQAAALSARGIATINCSPVSALTAFPRMTFEEAIEAVDLHRV